MRVGSFDYAIIGGGIVGLATAWQLSLRHPRARIVVLEKEAAPALHQTGRNSGVIHSGIYYKPGSLKARMARAGSASIVKFCAEHGLPCDVCGKLIVATRESQLPQLDALHARGVENGLAVERITAEAARAIEPHVACVGALRVPSTGITSYAAICGKLRELIEARGGEARFGSRVVAVRAGESRTEIETTAGVVEAAFVINCAGLHSDRVTALCGLDPQARIVPFRGEYYEIVPEKRHLVRHLIYPVPNPAFPFLGVHFTRMIDGSIHAGPNAVLAFAREGYARTTINLRDLAGTLGYPGFWKLASRHFDEGLKEIHRSLSKAAFVRSLQELIPQIQGRDLLASSAGVRAQALLPDGRLVDDFLIVRGRRSLHVCNAPSPAATASLEIGAEVASMADAPDRTPAISVL